MKSNNTLERLFILKKCDSFHACKEGCFHIYKSMTVVPPLISKIRQKPYYNFNRQKADRSQYPFPIKSSTKWSKGFHIATIEPLYDKAQSLYWTRAPGSGSLTSGATQGCPLLPCLFNTGLPFVTRATSWKKWWYPNWKESKFNCPYLQGI